MSRFVCFLLATKQISCDNIAREAFSKHSRNNTIWELQATSFIQFPYFFPLCILLVSTLSLWKTSNSSSSYTFFLYVSAVVWSSTSVSNGFSLNKKDITIRRFAKLKRAELTTVTTPTPLLKLVWKPVTDMDRTHKSKRLPTCNDVYTNKIHMVYHPDISVLVIVYDYFGTIFPFFLFRMTPEPTHPLQKLSRIFLIFFTLQSP